MNETSTTTTGTSTTINNTIQIGWKCPVCKNVMAPWQQFCIFCGPYRPVYTPPLYQHWWEGPYYATCDSSTSKYTTTASCATGKCPQDADATYTTSSINI